MSLNKVMLIGHLGADPEVRQTTQGVPVVSLRVATSERYKDKRTGQDKEQTEWHSVVIWGRHDGDSIATVAEKYLKKGSKVYLEGKLQTRKWQDQNGNDRWSTEIVLRGFDAKLELLDRKEGGGRPPAPDSPDDYGQTKSSPAKNQVPAGLDDDDSIPF